jgi:hypothetical protein
MTIDPTVEGPVIDDGAVELKRWSEGHHALIASNRSFVSEL